MSLSMANRGFMLSSAVKYAGKKYFSPRQLLGSHSLGFGNQVRLLNVHEHVSMEIMQKYGVKTPMAQVALSPEEAESIYLKMTKGDPLKDVVIKAQVLAGGRGLGTFVNGFKGGVHMCTRPGDASKFAQNMLNNHLVTKQTTAEGVLCSKVFLMERVHMRREMYLSLMLDRESQGPLLVVSPAGGTSIEDVAHNTPELIFTQAIKIDEGLLPEQASKMACNLGMVEGSPSHKSAMELMKNLYTMFIDTDATLIEVNPLAEAINGEVMVCDAKINFDDNAAFRQKEIHAKRDFTQEDPREVEAAKYDLNYIGLTGSIGCMVNGAGLAMSTMDIIKLKGGDPANFLDVGGGASESQVQKAFEILNADPKVKSILVNIFGGIMRCDVIANGVINAAKEIGLKKPIIIRLEGTNVKEANKLIQESGFKMTVCSDLEDAAAKAVAITEITNAAEKVGIEVSFS